jgi:hypothetical protein
MMVMVLFEQRRCNSMKKRIDSLHDLDHELESQHTRSRMCSAPPASNP